MTRTSFTKCGLSWLAIAGFAIAVEARAVDMNVSTLDVLGDDIRAAAVLQGTYDAQFRAAPDASAHLIAGDGRTHWLRLAFDLPAESDAHADNQVLRFDRVALDRITVYLPREERERSEWSDGFFTPVPEASLAPDSYAFAISHHLRGPQVVYVAVRGQSRITLTPRLIDERTFHAEERAISNLLSAIYASILVLTLSALALYLALRDRAYLHFLGLTSCLLLLLAAVNGHLYRLPVLDAFAWWRNNGIYALALLCSALAMGFTQHFLDAPRASASLSRWLQRARYALFAAAVFALLNLSSLTATLQAVAGVLVVLTALCVVGLTVYAWRQGENLARAYCLVWLIFAAAVSTRVALAFALLPQNPVTLYGFQVAAAFCLFLMSIGLADRVLEFRKQRDHAKELKALTEVSLQVEQIRRQFADGLREQLRTNAPGADLEWLAFKRLLGSLDQLLPHQGLAVIAFGYHGRDLLLTEPMDAKERYSTLVAARAGTLKSLCRTRKATQVRLDEQLDAGDGAPVGNLFAVVPMTISAGWGALLIERSASAPFDAAELTRAAEFLQLALSATEEATIQANLKRTAELDPLTGARNRRGGDVLMQQGLQRSLAVREPFSLLFADIDHFKQVNDRHGHAIGDDCLRLAAETIRHELRSNDVLVRYGGEEFLVILPGVAPDQARLLGERIRQAVMRLRLQNGSEQVRFTISIGVAGRLPGEEESQGIVERADRALYTAKRNGRNQVQVAQSFGYGKTGEDIEPPPPLSL